MSLRRRAAAHQLVWVAAAWLLFLSGCSSLAPLLGGGGTKTPPAALTQPPTSALPTPPAATQSPSARPPKALKIWLPEQFDLAHDTPAAHILRARLDQFVQENPGVTLDVRTKAENGPGGLMDSLSTASAAAPLALPDLVALPRLILEPAALKGYLRPLDGLTSAMESPDWYDYAHELSRLQKSTFGLPFAGDALVMAYQPAQIAQPPQDWAQTLEISATLAFPASDPEALFTLAQYQAAGGRIQDEQGRPALDVPALSSVLRFYQQAGSAGRMPFWLAQVETDAQVWDSWRSGQSDLNITWASRVLQSLDPGLSAAPIPTLSGPDYTLATGWVWSIASAGADPQRDALAVRLAEYLCEPAFMGRWTQAAGYLPTRSGAFNAWDEGPRQALARQLLTTARQVPSANILAVVGPGLRQAVTAVLRQQASPDQAAQDAAGQLKNP